MITNSGTTETQHLPIHIRNSDGDYVLTSMGRYKASDIKRSTIRKLARLLFSPRRLAHLKAEDRVGLLLLCLVLVSFPTAYGGVDHYLELTSPPDPDMIGGYTHVLRIRLKSGLLHVTGEYIRRKGYRSDPDIQGIDNECYDTMSMDYRVSIWDGDRSPLLPKYASRRLDRLFLEAIEERWEIKLGDLYHCAQGVPPFINPHTIIDVTATEEDPESLLRVFQSYDQMINPNDQFDATVMKFPNHLWDDFREENVEFD